MITKANSVLEIGTVIDFPDGKATLNKRRSTKAIENGADDLDFVCNYEALKW
jgi:deoxyribose-phosphate aldolase